MKPTSLRPKDKQDMTLEQVNEELKKKTAKRGIILKTLALIDNIKKDTEGPLWAHIRNKLADMVSGVENLEDRSDEYSPDAHPIPDRILWKSMGVRKAAKVILSIEKIVENEQGYRDSLVNVEKELKDLGIRKQRLG